MAKSKIMTGGWFSGKKTYITAAVGIVTSAGAYLTGDMELAQLIQSVFGLATAAFIRVGIENK